MFARIVIGCTTLAALTVVLTAEEPMETVFKPTVIFQGSHTAIDQEMFAVVTDATAWEKL